MVNSIHVHTHRFQPDMQGKVRKQKTMTMQTVKKQNKTKNNTTRKQFMEQKL